MNRQEILREIYLWYSKRAVFSRFGDIWLLSKKPLRRRVCNTQLALKKSSSRAFFLPLWDAQFLLRNFLVRQFEWDLLYPSKIRLPWYHLRLVRTRDKNSCLVADDTTRKFQNKCGYTTRPEIFNRLSCRIFFVAIATRSCLLVRMCLFGDKVHLRDKTSDWKLFHFLVAFSCRSLLFSD